MNLAFYNIVDAAYKLPISSKQELKNLLEQNIIEERRNQIVIDGKHSKEDYKKR